MRKEFETAPLGGSVLYGRHFSDFTSRLSDKGGPALCASASHVASGSSPSPDSAVLRYLLLSDPPILIHDSRITSGEFITHSYKSALLQILPHLPALGAVVDLPELFG